MKRQIDIIAMHNNQQVIPDPDNFEAPYRFWCKDVDMPGLAMSRSIGDAMAKNVGVIAEPEIQIYEFDKSSLPLAVVIASDGIWDMFDSNELG